MNSKISVLQEAVVHVLIEIPVIGSYFKENPLHDAGKCVASLIGGTIAMLYIMSPVESDATPMHIAKITAGMTIGMATGKIIYNGCYNSSAMLYNYLRNKPCCKNKIENYDAEIQPIIAAPTIQLS